MVTKGLHYWDWCIFTVICVVKKVKLRWYEAGREEKGSDDYTTPTWMQHREGTRQGEMTPAGQTRTAMRLVGAVMTGSASCHRVSDDGAGKSMLLKWSKVELPIEFDKYQIFQGFI